MGPSISEGPVEARSDEARRALVLHDRPLVVDLIELTLNHGVFVVRAAQNLNPPVAVVMLAINDPVRTGLVSSLHKRPFSKTPSPTRRSCLRRCPGHNPNAEISMTRGITCGNKDEPERQHLRKKMQCNARPFRRRFHDAIL